MIYNRGLSVVQEEFQDNVMKVFGLFIQSVSPFFIHFQLSARDGTGNVTGSVSSQRLILVTANDKGGDGNQGKLFCCIVRQAGRRLNEKSIIGLGFW